MVTKIIQSTLGYIGLILLVSLGAEANNQGITKISEQYGDMGLYETYKLQSKGDRCTYVILHGDTIIDTSCRKLTNSKGKQIYCTKKKKICKLESELLGKESIPNQKHVNKSSTGYARDLAILEKNCKNGETMDCYAVKRYRIFKKACDKGDRHSCKVLSNLRDFKRKGDAGDVSFLQSFGWSINHEKTSSGK